MHGINSGGHSVGRLMAGQHPADNCQSPLLIRYLGFVVAVKKGGRRWKQLNRPKIVGHVIDSIGVISGHQFRSKTGVVFQWLLVATACRFNRAKASKKAWFYGPIALDF